MGHEARAKAETREKEPTARVGEAWRNYNSTVLPMDAPAVQREECKLAFYAGAAAVFEIVHTISGDDVSEVEGVQRMEELSAEFDAWIAALKQKHGIV